MLALASSVAAGSALAHGGGDGLPDGERPRIDAAVALGALSADTALPRGRWPGQPGSGTTPADRRGLALEHATLGVAWRLPGPGADGAWSHGLRAVLGKHGQDRAHAEAAWWQLERREPALALRAGRDTVSMGEVIDAAGHLDRYAQAPLIKRLVLDDQLIADGLRLSWQPHQASADTGPGGSGLDRAELGLWQIKAWPASRAALPAPSLRLQGRLAGVDLSVFAASLRPRGRSMPLATTTAAHSHEQPDCRRSLTGLVCFDGRSQLAGASAQLEAWGYTFSAAGLVQRDQGDLYSARGAADYQGRQQGGWLEIGRTLAPRWHAGTRLERSTATHRLAGPSAALLAEDAGLLDNRPIQRVAAELDWTAAPGWSLSAEAGSEARRATRANRWFGLRLRWADGTP